MLLIETHMQVKAHHRCQGIASVKGLRRINDYEGMTTAYRMRNTALRIWSSKIDEALSRTWSFSHRFLYWIDPCHNNFLTPPTSFSAKETPQTFSSSVKKKNAGIPFFSIFPVLWISSNETFHSPGSHLRLRKPIFASQAKRIASKPQREHFFRKEKREHSVSRINANFLKSHDKERRDLTVINQLRENSNQIK